MLQCNRGTRGDTYAANSVDETCQHDTVEERDAQPTAKTQNGKSENEKRKTEAQRRSERDYQKVLWSAEQADNNENEIDSYVKLVAT